jgi:hypothetical protein
VILEQIESKSKVVPTSELEAIFFPLGYVLEWA